MIELFTSSGARDFRQRYEGTVGWVIGASGKKTLVNVESVRDRQVTLKDALGFDYTVAPNGTTVFEFQQVEAGWYPYKDTAAYMYRVPARQYQRGVSAGNTRIVSFTPNGLLNDINVNLETLAEIFSGKSSPLVWNRNFCLSPTGELYVHRTKIGATDKTGTIILSSDLFYQEALDVVRRNALSYKVSHE
jgi:hypothetical protein